MKVCKEYEVVDSSENPQNSRTLYALKETGNWLLYTDEGEYIDSTDDEHLDAFVNYYRLRKHYENK